MIWRSRGSGVGECADRYAAWAPFYPAEAHNPLMEVEQEAMLDLLPPLDGLLVLDVGCGTGRYARLARERGARRVVGVDLSASMLARSAAGADRVRGDIRALPLAEGSFDVIVSGLMLPDIAELGRVAAEWRRVLKPDGIVVCSTLHPVGAELGWTRTFETPHGTQTLPAHWHTVNDHRNACAAAGLTLEALSEPCLDSRPPRDPRTFYKEDPRFPRDPRMNSPRFPVALVMRARRPR